VSIGDIPNFPDAGTFVSTTYEIFDNEAGTKTIIGRYKNVSRTGEKEIYYADKSNGQSGKCSQNNYEIIANMHRDGGRTTENIAIDVEPFDFGGL
jgi:hypothetical protein